MVFEKRVGTGPVEGCKVSLSAVRVRKKARQTDRPRYVTPHVKSGDIAHFTLLRY